MNREMNEDCSIVSIQLLSISFIITFEGKSVLEIK